MVGVWFRRAISFVGSLISSVSQCLLGCCCCLFKRHGGRPPVFLGYFLQPNINVYLNPEIFGFQTCQFLPASNAARNLKSKPDGVDASLSFIGQKKTVYITGSSGGFLLACSEVSPQQHYFICNPVTREWRALPKLNKFYHKVALAFICNGGSSLDGSRFTVIRAGISNVLESTRKLELETFSSETGEWRESTLTCDRPFKLQACNSPPFDLDNVIYWPNISYCLLAHDLRTESLELIERPGGAAKFIDRSCTWGRSEGGKIIHARQNGTILEVWLLKKKNYYYLRRRPSYRFILLARVSLADMFPAGPPPPMMIRLGGDPGILAIHPCDSRMILVVSYGTLYWYNHENGMFLKICDPSEYGHGMGTWNYFLYEQPETRKPHGTF